MVAVAVVVACFPLQHECHYCHVAKVSLRRQSLDITRLRVAMQLFIILTNLVFMQRGMLNYITRDIDTGVCNAAMRALSYVY